LGGHRHCARIGLLLGGLEPRVPFPSALARLCRLDLAVACGGGGLERVEKTARGRLHLIDRTVKRHLVRLGRMCEAAELADELQGRRTNLILCRRGLEIEQRADVAAHGRLLGAGLKAALSRSARPGSTAWLFPTAATCDELRRRHQRLSLAHMQVLTGLNPYGLTYYLGLQGIGTARVNPAGKGLAGFIELATDLGCRVLEVWDGWLADLDE